MVPPVNAEYLHERLPKSQLEIIDAGHFIGKTPPIPTRRWSPAGGPEGIRKPAPALAGNLRLEFWIGEVGYCGGSFSTRITRKAFSRGGMVGTCRVVLVTIGGLSSDAWLISVSNTRKNFSASMAVNLADLYVCGQQRVGLATIETLASVDGK
jgi:hypothetical protein